MAAKVLIGLGAALTVLCGLVLLVSLALPLATDGRTSWDEALLGIVPSAICGFLSFLILIGGIAWFVVGRRKPKQL